MCLPISSLSVSVIILSLLASVRSDAASSSPTPHLRDVLLGRCFSNPPTTAPKFGDPADVCPPLVSELVLGAFEGKDDESITSRDFEPYFAAVDFSTEMDSALFWPGADADAEQKLAESLVRPEGTPGGSLLAGLTFCGSVDGDEGGDVVCPFGTFVEQYDMWTGAQAAFWSGAYSAFASEASGVIRVVTTDDHHPAGGKLGKESLFLTSALPVLDVELVSSAEIYLVRSTNDDDEISCDSSPSALEIMAALEAHGIELVTCLEGPPPLDEANGSNDEEIDAESDTTTITTTTTTNNNNNNNKHNVKHWGRPVALFAFAFWIVAALLLYKNINSWMGYTWVPEAEQPKQ